MVVGTGGIANVRLDCRFTRLRGSGGHPDASRRVVASGARGRARVGRRARAARQWWRRFEVTSLQGLEVAIVSRIYLPEPGAASFRLGALARQLRESGANTTVITSQPPKGYEPSPADHEGILVSRAPVLRDRMGYIRG